MKGTIVLVLMATTISVVYGGSLFDAKGDAKTAVDKKHKEAVDLVNKIKNDITGEKEKKDENSLTQAKNTLVQKREDTKTQLDKNVRESTRTAIAKGKPLQSIDCIENTLLEGEKIIEDSKNDFNTAIENVYKNKIKKLEFLEKESNLISDGLKDLIDQALKKIDDIKSGYDAVVMDASKKVDSAQKQLHEIEIKVPEPSLLIQYSNVKKMIESKYKEISDNLLKRLQKCVA